MEYLNKVANLQDYVFRNSYQYIEMIAYSAIAFFVPMLLGHPQLLVGAVVNGMLVLAGLNLKGHRLLPVIVAPSLGALTAGILFGNFTVFLLYMAPLIWIGNAILVFSFKIMKLEKKMNYWTTLISGSLLKAVFLFSGAFVLYSLGIVPVMFLTVMGVFQVYTALMGGAGAYLVQSAKRRFA